MVGRFPYRSAGALATAASVILFGLAAASAASVHTAASDSLTVTVGDVLGFTLSTDQITPGANVTLTIVQTSNTVDHTFTLSDVAGQTFTSSDTDATLLGFLHVHPALVNFSIPAGQHTYTTTFIAPPYGLYAYFCLVPGHFPTMYGILGSGEAGGSGGISDGPGAPVFIIGGTITTLVVVAIVLGFVVGKRRGSHDEMPPERLGYPEPPAAAGTTAVSAPARPPSP